MPSQCSAATGPAPIVKILIRLDLAVALALWKLRDFQKWDVTLRLSCKYTQPGSHFLILAGGEQALSKAFLTKTSVA